MYQTAPKGSAVARREAKVLERGQEQGEEFQAATNQTEARPTQSGFTQQCLPVVLMVQCDYLHAEKGFGRLCDSAHAGMGTHP